MLLFALFITTSVGFAQNKVGVYTMSLFPETEVYDLELDGKNRFYISMHSLDASSKKGGIRIDESDLYEFKMAVDSATKIYLDWSILAKQNSIQDLDKTMLIDCPKVSVFFLYGTKWHYSINYQRLKFRFKIMDNNQYVLIVNTGKIQASDNQFINSDGVAMVFTSEKEVKDFITSLDLEKANALLQEKKKSTDIFKQ